jgi:hypothetical protein
MALRTLLRNALTVIDSRGRYLDNICPSHRLLANDCKVVTERLWRSLKQEAVYLHEAIPSRQIKLQLPVSPHGSRRLRR